MRAQIVIFVVSFLTMKDSSRNLLRALDDAFAEKVVTGSFNLSAVRASVIDGAFNGRLLRDLRLTRASLSCSAFERCRFERVRFEDCCLDYVMLRNCEFVDTHFIRCSTDGLELTECQGGPAFS